MGSRILQALGAGWEDLTMKWKMTFSAKRKGGWGGERCLSDLLPKQSCWFDKGGLQISKNPHKSLCASSFWLHKDRISYIDLGRKVYYSSGLLEGADVPWETFVSVCANSNQELKPQKSILWKVRGNIFNRLICFSIRVGGGCDMQASGFHRTLH